MIDPSGIPEFTGDFGQLEKDVSALRKDAIGIRDRGMDVHSRFQMLEAFYSAPEADELFATTQPVMDKADGFATKLETVADALDTYSTEARPLAERLAQLKEEALAFVAGVEGQDDWNQDEDKVHRHQELLDGVTSAQSAFQDAERRAASKISSIVGGPKFVTDDGSHTVNKKTVMYGYGLDALEHAKELPWGTPEEQTYEAWSWGWFEHGAKSFVWDGLVKDNIEGGLDGLYTLFGGHGSKAAGQAWSGLKDVVTGIGLYTATPYDALMDWTFGPAKESADEIRSKKAAKEFAKGFVAWDKWDENPARASATVVFNVLTLGAGPLAVAAKGSEVGALAKGASVAAKVGEFVDPVSVGFKATGKAISTLPKLSDVTSRIFTGVDASTGAARVHSVMELDDGSKVVIENGEFIAYDKRGHLVSDAPQERSGHSQGDPEQTQLPERELAGVHVGSHPARASAHADGSFSGPGQDTGGGGRAHASEGAGTHNGATGHDAGAGGGQDRPHDGTAETSHHSNDSDGGGAADSNVRHVDENATPGDHSAHGNENHAERELTPEERKRIQDELVRKANDPDWFKKYYDARGHRLRKSAKVDGVELPILKMGPHGKWIAAYDMPSGPSETTFGSKPLGRDTVPHGNLPELDKITADRNVALELTNAEKAYAKAPSSEARSTLEEAQNAYDNQLGDVPNNSKISEALGEKAAALHVVQHEFPTAREIELPKTPNGADMFDQAYDLGGDERLVVEAKAPSGELDWRQGVADPEDPANPGVGDDGGAQGMRVKQGTLPYVRSILGVMTRRGGRDAEIAADLRKALKAGKLHYMRVKAVKPSGSSYAGAIMDYFKL